MKNALFGYTYQHYVAHLLLAMMDVERNIDAIESEALVDHQFDDIKLCVADQNYFFQIKDIDNLAATNLSIAEGKIYINGKPHKLSNKTNLLFFKKISIKTNCKILGFNAYELDGVYIISMSREQIEKRIAKLYNSSPYRRSVIQHYLSKQLDNRKLKIERKQLPSITVFDTRLLETNIKLSRKILRFDNILLIEGKPGVGKSHLVSYLQQQFKESVLYRFWISNQDRQYEQRLKYTEFKSDLSKKLFYDQKERSESELLEKLAKDQATVIIDGLDHVENYRNSDLQNFIDFIDRAANYCKVIVLSRPLKKMLNWKKQALRNWNSNQTKKVLKELYHIDDYASLEKIYQVTNGYPILVKYIAEQYKVEGNVNEVTTLDTVNEYYESLFKDQSGKHALSLFLCCRGYIMRSELRLFLDDFAGKIIEEFVDERPYLFEIKLNRISLYHDSLITYLRNSGIDSQALLQNVNMIVVSSLLKSETRFQSRIGHFEFPIASKEVVIRHYASVNTFKKFTQTVIDYEAVAEFYEQIRELLCQLDPDVLDVRQYYDLALIINTTVRDHISTLNGFYFTYTKLLLKHGYSEEEITSSGYLFGMLLYLKNQDGSFLYDIKDDSHYDTSRFYSDLENDIFEESDFFKYHSKPFSKTGINKALQRHTGYHFNELLKDILVNVYMHPVQHLIFPELYNAIEQYLNGDESKAARLLYRTLRIPNWDDYRFSWVLREVKPKLLALGIYPESNDYLNLTLKEYLQKHKDKGSFSLWPELLSYLRLALDQEKTIDIESIAAFWTKYHQRKDYSLFSLDYALTVFEKKGLIHWKDSVNLITKIQEISEKGYRWLLGSYLILHSPAFILELIEEFDLDTLRIDWFKLPANYIDVLPNYVYIHALYQQFSYHRTYPEIDINELSNLLHSNRLEDLKSDLKYKGYKLTLKQEDPRKAFLVKHQIPFKLQPNESRNQYNKAPEQRFEDGILDQDNQHMITEKGLKPADVASIANGNHTALAVPELFRHFEQTELQDQMKEILFNSITGKSGFSNYFNLPWVLPGTMLQVLSDCDFNVDFSQLFESFNAFLELSMFEIKSPVDKMHIK